MLKPMKRFLASSKVYEMLSLTIRFVYNMKPFLVLTRIIAGATNSDARSRIQVDGERSFIVPELMK